MPQIKKSYQEVNIPFAKMSWTPDVPAAALGPNEYSQGLNVETDVRGIRSVAGDAPTMPPAPGVPTFIAGGYRQPTGADRNDFYFIVATESGQWWACNNDLWQEITPVNLTTTYTQDQNITEAWSGTVPVFNDEQRPPMFWPEDSARQSLEILDATGDGITATITFATQVEPPFETGQEIVVQNISPTGYRGVWTVINCTTDTVEYACPETEPFSPDLGSLQVALVSDPLPRIKVYSNQLPIGIYEITAPSVDERLLSFSGISEFTADISGTTLTVDVMTLPLLSNRVALLAPGMYLDAPGIAPGTKIVRNISGQGDGSIWEVNISQTIPLDSFTGYPWGEDGVGPSAPYQPGDTIQVTDSTPRYYDGVYEVISCDQDGVTVASTELDAHTANTGTISPEYSWNYNPNWSSVYAKWLRIYNTPNVGSILVAGNLTAVNRITGETEQYPVTVQWSQNFGLNQVPKSWQPTTTNIANQLEVPLRGDSLDGFPCNGNFYVCSYWDTVVFSPLNYSTTNTPILGVRQFNQGRGLLNPNCWANADQRVYGIDARDVWVFDGNSFTGLGNQRVKRWLFNDMDPVYYSRVYMEVNTDKNQIEIYYPTREALAGLPNRMVSYRYDLDCWNPPREVSYATFACESPVWTTTAQYELEADSTSGLGAGAVFRITRTALDYTIEVLYGGVDYEIGDTLTFSGTHFGGASPLNDAVFTVSEIRTGELGPGFIVSGVASGTPMQHWSYDPASRTIVYAQGLADREILTKDVGYTFWNSDFNQATFITSYFTKNSIKFLQDYSGKVMIHRVLPEVINVTDKGLEFQPQGSIDPPISSVNITMRGSNSVGERNTYNLDYPGVAVTASLATNSPDPWVQVNNNGYRVNALEFGKIEDPQATGVNAIWMLTAISFQITQTEDDR